MTYYFYIRPRVIQHNLRPKLTSYNRSCVRYRSIVHITNLFFGGRFPQRPEHFHRSQYGGHADATAQHDKYAAHVFHAQLAGLVIVGVLHLILKYLIIINSSPLWRAARSKSSTLPDSPPTHRQPTWFRSYILENFTVNECDYYRIRKFSVGRK